MRTRRSVLVSVGGLITLTGCSQQSSQPSEESDAEGASGEFGIDQFRVGGESPDEYEAEFIAGSNASEVADELTPEVSYRISGASGEIETEVQYEYSDATIPEDEPLDETVEADTHDGNGEYAQSPSMPDSLVSEIVENPKNLVVTFRATDTESGETKTEEYELALADSYIQTATNNVFNTENTAVDDANLEDISVNGNTIIISFTSKNKVGSQEFNNELGFWAGGYSTIVHTTRIPYSVELSASGSDGEMYEKEVGNEYAKRHLNRKITQTRLANVITFDELWVESAN